MDVVVASYSLNWVCGRIGNLNRFDLPNVLTEGNDRLVAREITTLSKSSKRSATELFLVSKNLFNLSLSLVVTIKVSLYEATVLVQILDLLEVIDKNWVNGTKGFTTQNFIYDLTDTLTCFAFLDLLLIKSLPE